MGKKIVDYSNNYIVYTVHSTITSLIRLSTELSYDNACEVAANYSIKNGVTTVVLGVFTEFTPKKKPIEEMVIRNNLVE